MKWIVYLTTNKENRKIYIGVHGTENPNEFDGYIGNGIKIGNSLNTPKTIFQKALKKYGYSSFERKTLFVFDTPELAYSKEAELVTSEFIKQDSNYNMTEGGYHGTIKYKKVYQYDKCGNLIKIWEKGQVQIMDELGFGKNELVWAITQKVELQEHYWSLTPITDFKNFRERKKHYLYKFNLQGELLTIYESIAEAARILNVNYNTIKDAIHKKVQYMGYYWTNNINNITEIINLNNLFNTKKKRVDLYDLNGNFIKEFQSIKEVCNELKVAKQTVSKAATHGYTLLGKYKVKYLHIQNIDSTPILQIDYKTGKVVKEWGSLAECKKEHPKCKDVIKGVRNHTHGYTFKLKYNQIEDIV